MWNPCRSRVYFDRSLNTRLVPMSSDTFTLVAAAKRCALAAWPKIGSYAFTKAGVMLDDLLPMEDWPRTRFDAPERPPALMTALDAVNDRFGKKTMVLASDLSLSVARAACGPSKPGLVRRYYSE